MSDVVDRMAFPETPKEMHIMLQLEDKVKEGLSFTHISITGYWLKGGENGPIKGRIPESYWDAEGDRSADNNGV